MTALSLMTAPSASHSAMQGMARAQRSMAQHAQQIAEAGTGPSRADAPSPARALSAPVDLNAAAVGMTADVHAFQANWAVFRSADRLAGTVIDLLA